MMKKHITAFYLETVALTLVFLAVILVLTQVFSLAHAQSEKAGHLTEAVSLAERAAEAVAASDSLEDARDLLDENGNTLIRDGILLIREADYAVTVTWEPDGSLVRSRIGVSRDGAELYTLETAARGEAVP